MKKVILLISLIIIMFGSYYYYEEKTTEVLLSGKVVGFDIANLDVNSSNKTQNLTQTSSKSVGTITFINEENKKFVALGHSISEDKNKIDLVGSCYQIEFDHIKKGEKDTAGRIIAEIKETEKIGYIDGGNDYGIYGKIEIEEKQCKKIETANRFDISRGTAYLLINLDGKGIRKYEIEITDISYLSKNQNIRIKVKSEELIKLAGGIVQGMSGAPIIQNGKLVGAVNCVNTKNSLDAYAIFIDKLI